MKELQKNTEPSVIGIILAAGEGKRMKSNLPKVAHELSGKALVIWAIEAFIKTGIKQIIVVISPKHTLVEKLVETTSFPADVTVKFAYQNEPLGTGHAAQCGMGEARKFFLDSNNSNFSKFNVLIGYGDTPAVKETTFTKLITHHNLNKNSFTVLAFKAHNPFGYGRIIMNEKNEFIEIKEEKDCSDEQKKITLCNSGIICSQFSDLEKVLPLLKNINAANEYYLTDVPLLSKQLNCKVDYLLGAEESELLGINTKEQLAEMELLFQKSKLN